MKKLIAGVLISLFSIASHAAPSNNLEGHWICGNTGLSVDIEIDKSPKLVAGHITHNALMSISDEGGASIFSGEVLLTDLSGSSVTFFKDSVNNDMYTASYMAPNAISVTRTVLRNNSLVNIKAGNLFCSE